MRFWLGTHVPSWLERYDVPLFVQHSRLVDRRRLPRALGPVAIDSGGFTQLDGRGEWSFSPAEYAAAVRRYVVEVGNVAWAAPMDWMCEPRVLRRTGLTVAEHQRRTVANYCRLRDLAPDLPFVPVLQGWDVSDYLRCADLYAAAGVDLAEAHTVGVGTICRRQATREIEAVLTELAALGLALHGFGCKKAGLRAGAHLLASADSLAWSDRGQHVHPADCDPAECTNCARGWSEPSADHCGSTAHRSEANCPVFALAWRDAVLAEIGVPKQLALAVGAP